MFSLYISTNQIKMLVLLFIMHLFTFGFIVTRQMAHYVFLFVLLTTLSYFAIQAIRKASLQSGLISNFVHTDMPVPSEE